MVEFGREARRPRIDRAGIRRGLYSRGADTHRGAERIRISVVDNQRTSDNARGMGVSDRSLASQVAEGEHQLAYLRVQRK